MWFLSAAFAALPPPDELRGDPQLAALRAAVRTDAPARRAVDPEAPGWDITRYTFDLTVDPAAGRLTGAGSIDAVAIGDGPLVLDALGLDDLGFTVDGVAVTPERDGEVLLFRDLGGDSVQLDVSWGADVGEWFGLVDGGDVIYTSSEPNLAHDWLPCHDVPDDKAELHWTIRAPEGLTVAAVGDFVGSSTAHGWTTWEWDEAVPLPTYLYAFHVGDYVLTTSDDPIPVWTWAYPDVSDAFVALFGDTPAMLALFEDDYGPYAFSRYGNVIAPMPGAMENPGAVTFDDGALDYGDYASLMNVHELGHHWWGDDVTLASWADIWLNEGFATYTEALWYEQAYGEEGLAAYVASFQAAWAETDGTGTVYDPDQLFGTTVYEKGGYVVHMLRGLLGDETFFAMLRTREEAHRFGTESTADLQDDAEAAYGDDLSWFFDEYVYAAPVPEVSWGWKDDDAGVVEVAVDTQGVTGFRMPFPVRLTLADGSTRDETVEVVDGEGSAVWCLDQDVVDVMLDPLGYVLVSDTSEDLELPDGDPVCDGMGAPEGCGCATGGASGGLLLVAGALGALGRRRR